jgi:hypothetical protein
LQKHSMQCVSSFWRTRIACRNIQCNVSPPFGGEVRIQAYLLQLIIHYN